MKKLLGLVVGVFAALLLIPVQASASTLADCVAKQEVCVAGDGRSLISQGQQAKLDRQIGGDPSTWWSPRPAPRATTAR